MMEESCLEFLDSFSLALSLDLLELDLALGSSLEPTDDLAEILVLVEVGSEGGGEVVEFVLVFLADLSEGDDGGVLLVDQFAEGSLSLHEAVGDFQFAAEVGEPDDQLDGVDVVGDDHQLGLLLLDELGDVVESELQVEGLGVLHLLL